MLMYWTLEKLFLANIKGTRNNRTSPNNSTIWALGYDKDLRCVGFIVNSCLYYCSEMRPCSLLPVWRDRPGAGRDAPQGGGGHDPRAIRRRPVHHHHLQVRTEQSFGSIRLRIQSGSRVLMTKNWRKKFTAGKTIIYSGSKTTQFTYP